MIEPEIAFLVNDRTGEVHAHDCPRVKVIHSKSAWNPAKAALTPGVYADKICLPGGLPLRRPPGTEGAPSVTVALEDLRLVLAAADYMSNRALLGPVDRMTDAVALATMRIDSEATDG